MLTNDNYYSDTTFMSNSRMKGYMDCEAKQLAIDNGEWEDNKQGVKALLVGNFIHSYFESPEAHQEFLDTNHDYLFSKAGKTKGQLLKDFKVAEQVIKNLEEDDYFQEVYNGKDDSDIEKELIVTGKLEDVAFKGKLDSVNHTQKYFVDLKTMQSLNDMTYSPVLSSRVPQMVYNIFEYGYLMQVWLYRELLYQQTGDYYTPYILACSKQELTDKELIKIDEEALEIGKKQFYSYIDRLKLVTGEFIPPKKCHRCDYCRHNKKLGEWRTISEILAS